MAKKPLKKTAKSKPAAKKAAPRATPAKARAAPASGNKQRFTLHGFALSGPTYTAALMLALSRHPYSYIHINLREGAHRQPDYLVKNRFGQVPALRDGAVFIVQSAAILEYLAESLKKFEGKTPLERQRVREWLFWLWDRLAPPIFRLRSRNRGTRHFGDETRIMYEGEAKQAFAVLENELARSEWIVGKRPTIADIGIYGAVHFAGEAGLDLAAYPRLQDWKKRFEALPGFATPQQLLPLESRLL
jgi:glutathione S-transferase